MMESLFKFPSLGRETLRDFKKGIDSSFRDFSRENGEGIENFFEPLLQFLVWFDKCSSYRDDPSFCDLHPWRLEKAHRLPRTFYKVLPALCKAKA